MTPGDVEQARMLLELDRPAQAREMLQKLVASDPHDTTAMCTLAQAYLAEGHAAAALQAATTAVQLSPDEEWPLRLAALAMARCRRRDEARIYAESAIAVEPHNWRTHLARAQVDLVTRAVGPTTIYAANQAIALAPHEAQCFRVLGSAHLALRNRDQAEQALREALRLAPDDAAARNDLARVHVLRRNLGRAAAGFAEAAALDPTDPIAAENLGVVGAKALRVVHVIMWIALVVVGGQGSSATPTDRRLIGIGWLVTAASLAGFGSFLWWGSRPRTWTLLRIVGRRDRMLELWSGCLVLAFVLLGTAVIAPRSAIPPLITCSFLAVAAGTIVTWARSLRLRRRRPAR